MSTHGSTFTTSMTLLMKLISVFKPPLTPSTTASLIPDARPPTPSLILPHAPVAVSRTCPHTAVRRSRASRIGAKITDRIPDHAELAALEMPCHAPVRNDRMPDHTDDVAVRIHSQDARTAAVTAPNVSTDACLIHPHVATSAPLTASQFLISR